MNIFQRLLTNLFTSGGSLTQQTTRGFFWSFLTYGGSRTIALVRSVILARLLLPADFGLVGMADVATGFLAVFTELGVSPALIFNQAEDEEILHTAWWISCLRGILLCAVTYLVSGPVSIFFKTPELKPLLQVLSLCFIGYGFTSVGLTLFRKELNFRTLTYLALASEGISLVAAVIAAFIFRDAWALVISVLVRVIIILVGSYYLHPYRPRLIWSWGAAKKLINYGKFFLGRSIVGYLHTQGDNALVGRILGSAQLGFYRQAFILSSLPHESITGVINQVTFPAFSKLQNDLDSLRNAYTRILKVISIFSLPIAAGLILLSHDLVLILYGQKWLPMVIPLMMLTIGGLEKSLTSPIVALLDALGRPHIVLYLSTLKLIILGITIIPLTIHYGIIGTSAAVAFTSLIVLLYIVPIVKWILKCNTATIIKPLIGPCISSFLMVVVLLLLNSLEYSFVPLLKVTLFVIVGTVIYFSSLFFVDKNTVKPFLEWFASGINQE